jgi:branched-chain amino acid transport system permease protein
MRWLTTRLGPWLAASWPFAPLAAGVAGLSLLGALGSDALDRVVVTMLINMVLVIGLFLFIGNSGVFSFGHVAFMAVGAYICAILIVPPDRKGVLFPEMFGPLRDASVPTLPATILGGVGAAALALIVSIPLMRLSGLAAALASFTLLIVINVVSTNWEEVTNATSGISGLPGSLDVVPALGWCMAILLLAALYQATPSAFRLRGSREDGIAARAIGIRVARERRVAFVLSAFAMGVGGGLFAQSIGSITPSAFYLTITFLLIAMLVVGGMESLTGAVVGAVVLSAIAEILRRFEQGVTIGSVDLDAPSGLREVGFGVAMLLILLLRPTGLVGRREVPMPARLASRWSGPEVPAPRDRRES